jgi:dipeptidyl aminopeptidase/acylaminoacyl peptidase
MPTKPTKILVTLLLLMSGSWTEARANELPIEYFVRHAGYKDIKISPDGEYVAATVLRDGKTILAFIKRGSNEITAAAEPGGDGHVLRFRWISDKRVIYQVAELNGPVDTPRLTGELYAIDRDGDDHEIIYGVRAGNSPSGSRIRKRESTFGHAEIIHELPEDDEHVLILEYPWKTRGRGYAASPDAVVTVTRLDVYQGDKQELERLPFRGASAIADREGNVRFAVAPREEGGVKAAFREPDSDEWQNFDLPGIDDTTITPLSFGPDNEMVYIAAVPNDGGTRALFRVDPDSGNTGRLIWDEDVDMTGYIRDVNDHRIVGVRTMPGKPEYHYIEGMENKTVRIHQGLRQAFPGKEVRFTSHTEGGSEIIVHVASDRDPGRFFFFDTEAMHAQPLMANRSWVDPEKMRPMQPVSLNARDGLELHGYMTLPADSEGPAPFVVLPHGGPHGIRDTWGYAFQVQLLANRGYGVLQVNFRGSGGYGKDFEEAGHGEWGAAMQNDLTDATRWAIEQGHADPDRICIFGASYGGYAALMGAAREPGLYQCAIGYVGVYDLPMMFEEGDIPTHRFGRSYLKRVLGEDEEALEQRSPAYQADRIEAGVFLAAGGQDPRAPIEQSERMREQLEETGKEVGWLAYDREGHGFFQVDRRERFYGEVLEFLDAHIGSD